MRTDNFQHILANRAVGKLGGRPEKAVEKLATSRPGCDIIHGAKEKRLMALCAPVVLLISASAAVLGTEALELHAFASQGYVHTSNNDFLAETSRGSFAFTEVGLALSAPLTERMSAGVQLFGRKLGDIEDFGVVVDWAHLSYRWFDWLRCNVGYLKMPWGLYNEVADIDAARPTALLPQALYDMTFRLLTVSGASIGGDVALGLMGGLAYQLYAGQMSQPKTGAFDIVFGKVFGGRLLWETPLDGLRVGGSIAQLDTAIIVHFPDNLARPFEAIGLSPTDPPGGYRATYADSNTWVLSLEYDAHDILLAAEYGRWTAAEVDSVLEALMKMPKMSTERYYGMLGYRFAAWVQAAAYYSVYYQDTNDRAGRGLMFPAPHAAWQKDAALALRFDVNSYWILKLEGHRVDGTNTIWVGVGDAAAGSRRRWNMLVVRSTFAF